MFRHIIAVGIIGFAASVLAAEPVDEVAVMELPRSVCVTYGGRTETLSVPPLERVTVEHEEYTSIARFDPNGPFWRRGTVLQGVNAMECCVSYAYEPGSLVLESVQADGSVTVWERGKDYEVDDRSGNIGWLAGGGISETTAVRASYRHATQRLDSVVCNADGSLELVEGVPHASMPQMPELAASQKRLGNIWTHGLSGKLTEDSFFPISKPKQLKPMFLAKEIAPRTVQKLERGESVRILAWGDSVTAGGFVPEEMLWQNQFLRRLQARYPQAKIELISNGWGGRTMQSFRDEPAGSAYNYAETVLAVKPDLVISEFVNDAYLDLAGVQKLYGATWKDFQEIGAEWIILTPHYVVFRDNEPQKNIDEDPRPYTQALRQFAAENSIGLADGAFLYGQLYRQGIPYVTLMTNNINHPNAFGLSLFADALMGLFP